MFSDLGGIDIAIVAFVTLSFVWNVVQAWVFIQEQFKPPEDKAQFDGRDHAMLQELYQDLHKAAMRDSSAEALSMNLTDVLTKVYDMHNWQSVTDEDGNKIWYVPRRHLRMLSQIHNKLCPNESCDP